MKRFIEWIKSLFKREEEFDVEVFSKGADEVLKQKLKIIYASYSYRKERKEIYEWYEEFKEEHKDKIGKIFECEYGTFKITKVKEPWFLKSPILVDSANFKWKFDEAFEVEPLDNYVLYEINIRELEQQADEVSKEYLSERLNRFVKHKKGEQK